MVRANRAKKVSTNEAGNFGGIRMNVPGVERPQSPHQSPSNPSFKVDEDLALSCRTLEDYKSRQIMAQSQDLSISINQSHHQFSVPQYEANDRSDSDE